MCGISGFLASNHSHIRQPFDRLMKSVIDRLEHRGPDDVRVWCDESNRIALGHARLSIIDLSPAGSQPMHSHCARYVMVFNGEIYNFNEIREELEKLNINFKGHSDTEVLLAGIVTFGFEEMLKRTVGMFALALWDKQDKQLYLARDRIGEKPLYYGWHKGVFLFASEIKAFKAWPDYQPTIDQNVLSLYLQYNYVPAPYCIFKGFRKLVPGSWIKLSVESIDVLPEPIKYWSVDEVITQAQSNPFSGNEDEAVNELDNLLQRAVRQCMISDVPLGAFLSGGVDSSTIVSLMQAQSMSPVRTFSVGFSESDYDESKDARLVAKHLKTEHTELTVSSNDAFSVIPELAKIYDEPFADSSQLPTFLVSKLARQSVTVALSGDGADELFAGYNRHVLAARLNGGLYKIPHGFRKMLGSLLLGASPSMWNSIYKPINKIVPARYQLRLPGERIHKLGRVMGTSNIEELYKSLTSISQNSDSIVKDSDTSAVQYPKSGNILNSLGAVNSMLYRDILGYLPDDILVKVDRAAMAVSLETRIPYLDHRVVEFAWQVPCNYKVHNDWGKWILRQVLYKYVPRELVDRPKMGFGVPLDSWLRHSLRDWAENLLSIEAIEKHGFFNAAPIRKIWEAHISGRENRQHELWAILMFQAWHQQVMA